MGFEKMLRQYITAVPEVERQRQKRKTPVSGYETTAGNLHSYRKNRFLIISNHRDVIIVGKIKFAWTLAIKAEMKTHEEQRIFQVVLVEWQAVVQCNAGVISVYESGFRKTAHSSNQNSCDTVL